MIVKRYISTASVICSLAFGLTGTAMASDVSFDTTGPDSTQQVVIKNSSDTVVSNTSVVQVTNENVQNATTGDVSAAKNTSVEGPIQSGDASNSNGTVNTVAISNDAAAVVVPVGGNGGSTACCTTAATTPGSGGAVQGASTVAGGMGAAPEMLPEVGASFPVDVSALRAAWHPQSTAPAATLAKGSSVFTTAMLVTATLLSLLGAIGSAVYARRKERV